MPITPAPPDATARLLLRYTSGGHDHTVLVRYLSASLAAAAADVWHSMLTAQSDHFDVSTTFTGADVIDVGSNVANPLPWDGITCVGTALTGFLGVRYLSISGRGFDGRKVRYTWFGFVLVGTTPSDYRESVEEDVNVSSFRSDFDDVLVETSAVTVGGVAPVLKSYTNVGMSGYWQRQRRG